MDIKHHSQPQQLESYSFWWSEARLVIAAIALFLGGVPPIYYLLPVVSLYGLEHALLLLAWIISGVAACYLLYRWYAGKQAIFGRKDPMDTTAFFVLVVSGINLGLAGLLRTNIGMTITMNRGVFILVGIIYLATAFYLFQKWQARGQKLF